MSSMDMEFDDEDSITFQSQPMGEDLIPQTKPLTYDMVPNSAGGYSYEVNDETRLLRYLCLGTEGGSYYVTGPVLKRENIQCIDRLIMNGKGPEAVKLIRDVSVNGRACKQTPTLNALAICARSNDPKTKAAAYSILLDVCRIPTHLFEFVNLCEKESAGSGWGRAHRSAIGKWYNQFEKDPKKLALLTTKYKARHGWSHKDVIRLGHVKPRNNPVGLVIRYIIKNMEDATSMTQHDRNPEIAPVKAFLDAVEQAKKCTRSDIEKLRALIAEHQLVREHVPTDLLDSKEVWDTMLRLMPMTAMIRNLGKMSSLELLEVDSFGEKLVTEKLKDTSILKRSRIHPFTILIAYNQYKAGRGDKGKLSWQVNDNIVKALEKAFYEAFSFVQPTGKKFCLAVDVSGSMRQPVIGASSIEARDASAAMMLLTAKTEKDYEVVAFSNELTRMDIRKEDTLETAIQKCSDLPFSSTDCALPMKWAMEHKKKFDVFVVYTDSETYYGNIHPATALQQYRNHTKNPEARLIVVGMVSNGFSIADPKDPLMMDVIGFDTEAPKAMNNFVSGKF
ncbi:RNA-binding protein RO60-like [Mytilus trossulus]|uniref:RNA-binding protein RO60-like n=1 Tax=Mytilus trossulus TaxID=6551 RepID=UPI003006EA32